MNFIKRHPILFNLLLLIPATLIVVSLAMLSLNLLTAHGKTQIVPDVKNLSVAEATRSLHGFNLQCEVVDSVYDNVAARGAVTDQVPPAGNIVKPGRTVYLTINAYEPRKVTLPELVGTSLRQAQATLHSLGFSDVKVVEVPSDYKNLVLAVKSLGVTLRGGTRLPASSSIVIEVGMGYDPYQALNDSIEAYDSSEWEMEIDETYD